MSLQTTQFVERLILKKTKNGNIILAMDGLEVKMNEIFLRRLEELEISDKEREFVQKNKAICCKIYLRGIRDMILLKNRY